MQSAAPTWDTKTQLKNPSTAATTAKEGLAHLRSVVNNARRGESHAVPPLHFETPDLPRQLYFPAPLSGIVWFAFPALSKIVTVPASGPFFLGENCRVSVQLPFGGRV